MIDEEIEKRCRIITMTPGEKDKHILFANKVFSLILEYRGIREANARYKEIELKYNLIRHFEDQLCQFKPSYVDCNNHACREGRFCPEHDDLKCSRCGEHAIRECESGTSLICSRPLCEKCECEAH
jgi:hypothetical protein